MQKERECGTDSLWYDKWNVCLTLSIFFIKWMAESFDEQDWIFGLGGRVENEKDKGFEIRRPGIKFSSV